MRSALHASGLSLPPKRIIVNLAPADLPKEGSHYDLPIALALMAAIGAVPGDQLGDFVALGELSLDGTIAPVAGVLPAAIAANARGSGLICPAASGPEAAWASGDMAILAPRSLIAIANHFRGTQMLHAARGRHRRGRRRAARPCRHQGPGDRQARPGGRRRRRPQPADGRPARRRQVDAGQPPALHPAAAFARRSSSKSP